MQNKNITFESKDFSEYEFNNWKKVDNNDVLNRIDARKASLWLDRTGALCYRFSDTGPVTTVKNYKQANVVFTNFINTDVLFINKKNKDTPANVLEQDLKMVLDDDFNPFILEEFFEKDNLCYRNIFKPSKYLQLQPDEEYKEIDTVNSKTPFEAIKKLMMHLVNYDLYRFNYVINWLAYFFQSLKKSQVALVLRGNQGAGKGILFNEIIKPLFGEDYCTTVNDKSLRSAYLGGIVENEIFFNLDEISHQKAESTNIKNFLKALVTNDTITAEKKFVTLEKGTKIYGQVLITSNEPYVLDIEQSDRRYTIFTTADNLTLTNFLGYDKYDKLSKKIEEELEEFAKFLKSYEADVKLANQALNTPEKEELQQINMHKELEKQQRLQKSMQVSQPFKVPEAIMKFAYFIRTKYSPDFIDLKFENEELYNEIKDDFEKNIFKIKNLLPCFQLLYGDEMRVKYVSILLKELRRYDPFQFNDTNYKEYKEEDERVDYISIVPYIYQVV